MSSKNNAYITLSTITPVYSGKDYLESLVDKLLLLRSNLEQQNAPLRLVESIFVDDESVDGSSELLAELEQKYSWLTVITLSRNYGQHAATIAGICHAASDWVVTLDEDLQHEPELIMDLFKYQALKKLDIVYAQPKQAAHGNSWRDKSSRLVKRLIAKFTSTPQILVFNSFRLIRGSIARAAASSSISSTYFDISLSWFSKSYGSIEVDLNDQRFIEHKKSGYGFVKLARHARRLIVSAELDFTLLGLVIGFCAVLGAIGIASVAVFQKFFFPAMVSADGWTSLIVVSTFFAGVTLTLLCIGLEYLHVILLNSLGRPTYFTVDRRGDKQLADWLNSSKAGS